MRVSLVGLLGPDAYLDFTDVLLAEHPLGNSVDTDSTTNGVNWLFILNLFVVVETLGFFPGSLDLRLTLEGSGAHSNTHGA